MDGMLKLEEFLSAFICTAATIDKVKGMAMEKLP